jgi:CBS-domain-containing membrane protein
LSGSKPKAPGSAGGYLLGGHLLSTFVGLLIVKLCGPMPWAAALAVGLAMIVMHLTGTFHPPAGIDPLVVVLNNMSWSFLVVPVAVGALLLALFAFTWHNLVARGASAGSQNAAALDFRELGNDAPVAAVQVRRDGLTLCFDASTLLDATRNELTM